MNVTLFRMATLAAALLLWGAGRARAEDPICKNPHLYEVFTTIDRACNEETCDEGKLQELNTTLERGKVLAAMKLLTPIHVFFPIKKSQVAEALDFQVSKKDQLSMLKYAITNPEDTAVYVVGRGSAKGSDRVNWELSRRRTLSVYQYLVRELQLTCRYVQKVAFGKTILQLSPSDASVLGISPNDYRSDVNVLNQSVEVFIYPCRNSIHRPTQ